MTWRSTRRLLGWPWHQLPNRRRIDVTVIIPVYNKASHLRACLDSVLGQSGVSLEVICVDDASTDGSAEIAEEFAKRHRGLRVLQNAVNRGAHHSRNVAIPMARGRYLQFTDADDLLPEGSLAALLEAVEQGSADVAKGNFQALRNGLYTPPGHLVDPDGKLWPTQAIQAAKVGALLDLPELWIPWFHVCYLISRDLLVPDGARYPKLVRGEDPVFIARVLTRARRISIIPRVTYTYRQEGHRPPPDFRALRDYIEHARLVKESYAGHYAVCWDTYGPFVKNDTRMLVRHTSMSADETLDLERRLEAI